MIRLNVKQGTVQRRSLKRPGTPNHRLRDLRRNRGWSPERLGLEAGGVSSKTIRDIEAGRTKVPRDGTMFALAEALRVKVTDLDPTPTSGSRT